MHSLRLSQDGLTFHTRALILPDEMDGLVTSQHSLQAEVLKRPAQRDGVKLSKKTSRQLKRS
jgi:hypothetical protein